MLDSKHNDDSSGEHELLSLLVRVLPWVGEMAEMATISPDLTYLADRAERIRRDFELLAKSPTAGVSPAIAGTLMKVIRINAKSVFIINLLEEFYGKWFTLS